MKRLLLLPIIAAVLVFGGLAAVGTYVPGNGTVSAQGQTAAITIQNFAFSPATITVQPGTTVTWTNKDTTAHTVTVDSGNGPNSGNLNQDQTYSFKFDSAGTFAYHCSIHPQMKATVVVAAANTQTQQSQTQQQSGSTSQPSQSSGQSSTSTQQPTGGMGGGTSTTTPTTGSVEAGSGSTAGPQHLTALIASTLSILAGIGLLVSRRLFPRSR